jgi:peptidoglycan-associated lipoprotein
MKRFLLILVASVLMVGCGSSVKLDDVPVEDKSGVAVGSAGAAGSGSGVAQGGVMPVELDGAGSKAMAPNSPKTVFFDYDSFVIKPEFQSVIAAHARFISADKAKKVVVEGHTDMSGGREYNLALGQKRAEAVRRALGLLGVSENQIEAVSFGKEKPAALGSDEKSMSLNRRAEISYR